MANRTRVTTFILVGFTGCHGCQQSIFASFLFLYILVVLENLLIVALILQDSRLHKPMYIYLGNLSFLDIWYVSVTLPNMLVNILTGNHEIVFNACAVQLYIFNVVSTAECYLLATMAYDRYVAICQPLRYTIMMQDKCVLRLLAGSWSFSFFAPIVPVWLLTQLDFCGPRHIEHYFCDTSPLVSLSCGENMVKELADFAVSVVVLTSSISVILVSYTCIALSIMSMSSSQGRSKAFSTCTSHLAVVCLFYISMGFTYVRVESEFSFSANKLVSVFHSVITPTLNPMIYTFRNKDMKVALNKALKNNTCIKTESFAG